MIHSFHIKPLDEAMRGPLQQKIDNLTKPRGSLGRLEELALQIGLVQHTLTPELRKPVNVVFGADHGIIDEGVSLSPKEVTWQQMCHFSRGGAGINFLCKQHHFRLVLVDAGVDFDFPAALGIIDCKMGRGTHNFLHGPAMSVEQFQQCLLRGAAVVDSIAADGTNVVSFGEMGSGNTSPSSMWMHILSGIPLHLCVGAGAGLDDAGVSHKLRVLTQALQNYRGGESLAAKLAWFGGFELAMAVGAMLRAAELGLLILVDGFIMTACMAAARAFNPLVTDYAVFAHQGDESGHKLFLDWLGAKPLLNLSMRLGEGSGAVCAFPIVDSAVRMIREMDSFARTDVTKYF